MLPKPTYVRVSRPAGEDTVTDTYAAGHGLEVIDKPAVDAVGKPLPPKPRVSKGTRRKSPAPVTPTEPEVPADDQKEG